MVRLLLLLDVFSSFFGGNLVLTDDKLATVKSLKANVSNVSPSSIAPTNARSPAQLLNSLRWPIYAINSVDDTKLPCYIYSSTDAASQFL